MTLSPGDMYLKLVILGKVDVILVPNKRKTKPTDPDFVGNGVAIWKNTKKHPESIVEKVTEPIETVQFPSI